MVGECLRLKQYLSLPNVYRLNQYLQNGSRKTAFLSLTPMLKADQVLLFTICHVNVCTIRPSYPIRGVLVFYGSFTPGFWSHYTFPFEGSNRSIMTYSFSTCSITSIMALTFSTPIKAPCYPGIATFSRLYGMLKNGTQWATKAFNGLKVKILDLLFGYQPIIKGNQHAS